MRGVGKEEREEEERGERGERAERREEEEREDNHDAGYSHACDPKFYERMGTPAWS